jgi:metal-responsive CopG/Arc/MetJ family transcriptional regulator
MTKIKTAVSLPEALFTRVDKLAREMKVSRSRVFALALESFVRDYQDRRLFDQINAAYANEPPGETEQAALKQIRKQHRRVVEGEW